MVLVCAHCERGVIETGAPGDPLVWLDPLERPETLNFQLPTLAGASLELSSLRDRVIVLNFWATWCAPCLKEMPDLAAFDSAMASEGASVIGLCMDCEDVDVANHLIDRLKVHYPIVLADESLKDLYMTSLRTQQQQNRPAGTSEEPLSQTMVNLDALPTTLVLDRKGRIAAYRVGLLDMGGLRATVDRLLSNPAD